MKHVLSFDIEDWFHLIDIPELEDTSSWDLRPSIVEEKTELILSILDEFDTKATFFVLGWIARKYPSISKQIVSEGHELGTHSYWHRKVFTLDENEFYKDLKLSIDVLQDQTGVRIKGFRAPSFSIIPGTEWAFNVISQLDLVYDASLFPAPRDNGGYPCLQKVHKIETNSGVLFEIPMSAISIGPLRLPFSGGGYMRLLPQFILDYNFDFFEKKNTPVVVYLHPRDFAPEQPTVKMPLRRKLQSYVGLKTTEIKLRTLLKNYKFTTCEDILLDLQD